MVDGQHFPTVHLNKTAKRKSGMVYPQLLCPLKGDPLCIKPDRNVKNTLNQREEITPSMISQLRSQTHLMMIVVHQTTYNIGLLLVQFFQHVGRV